MPRAVTVWGRVHAVFAAGFWLFSLGGCKADHKRPSRESRDRPFAAAPGASSASSTAPENGVGPVTPPIPSAVLAALREVREQKLEIVAPRRESVLLAFGKGRLVQAAYDKLIFRDSASGAAITQASVGSVLGVATGSDGSLFGLGMSGGARLEASLKRSRSFAHVAFFPGAALFPDLEDPSHFYVYYGGQDPLFQYAFEAEAGAFLPIDARYPLEGCTCAVSLLRDGAFVCGTKEGILRQAPRGRRTQFKLPAGVAAPMRLLPAARLDELFSVGAGGEVVHLRLEPDTPVLGRFQLPAVPFAAAGNGEVLAFVLVTAPQPGQARQWALLVTDAQGQQRFRTDLEAQSASAENDWLQGVVGDKNLAISEFEPLVAVGGAGSLAAWSYADGHLLFKL